VVLLVGVLITGTLAAGAWWLRNNNEDRLLRLPGLPQSFDRFPIQTPLWRRRVGGDDARRQKRFRADGPFAGRSALCVGIDLAANSTNPRPSLVSAQRRLAGQPPRGKSQLAKAVAARQPAINDLLGATDRRRTARSRLQRVTPYADRAPKVALASTRTRSAIRLPDIFSDRNARSIHRPASIERAADSRTEV
jgi:hypothetical protein